MIEKTSLTLGEQLANARESLGLTFAEMANKTGISSTQLKKYEKDKVEKPQRNTLNNIAEAYGVPIETLHSHFNTKPSGTKASQRISDLYLDLIHGNIEKNTQETTDLIKSIFYAVVANPNVMAYAAKKVLQQEAEIKAGIERKLSK